MTEVNKTPPDEIIEKAGVVAFTPQRSVLICTSLTDLSKWVLPKGHLEEKEDHLTAAKRESKEELGWEVEILDTDPVGDYKKFEYFDKETKISTYERVVFFLALIKNRVSDGERPILQVPVLQAIKTLTFDNHQMILLESVRRLAIIDYFEAIK